MSQLPKVWFFLNIHKLKIVIFSILIYSLLPFLLLGIALLYITRKCITIGAKIHEKRVDKIISPVSALLAADDLYGIPSNNAVVWFVLNGQVSVDSLQSVIYENIISKQNASGHLLYPELQQFPFRFCKFMFWVWDEEFSIQTHVHRVIGDDNKVWNEADILKLQDNLLRKQWMRNKSLWELLLVSKYKETNSSFTREHKTVMLLRFHGSLGDPSSWFRLFLTNLCDCNNEQGHFLPNHHSSLPTPNYKACLAVAKRSAGIRRYICDRFITPLGLPFYFVQTLVELSSNEHAWNVEEKALTKRDHFKIIEKFSVQHIKDIKFMLGVSFTSVILAATTSAIRTTLLTLGQTTPKNISIGFPMMDGCHCDIQDKLCSHRSVVCIKLPVGIASSKERLRLCQASYTRAKETKASKSNESIQHFLGLLPITWAKPIQRNLSWSGTLLNLPCTAEYVSILDSPIKDMVVAVAPDIGFSITFLSYVDSIRMSLVCDHQLIPAKRSEVAKDMLKNFYSELVVLGIEAVV